MSNISEHLYTTQEWGWYACYVGMILTTLRYVPALHKGMLDRCFDKMPLISPLSTLVFWSVVGSMIYDLVWRVVLYFILENAWNWSPTFSPEIICIVSSDQQNLSELRIGGEDHKWRAVQTLYENIYIMSSDLRIGWIINDALDKLYVKNILQGVQSTD